jgi:NAD+ synthase
MWRVARAERIASWMRGRLASAGARGFVVGLSGGVDSAVVARLSQLAAPGAVLAVLLPCRSDPRDEQDAQRVATQFSIPTTIVDLGPAYDAVLAAAERALELVPRDMRDGTEPGRVPPGNIKARLRMTTLYYFANAMNYLVAGTGNKSELAIGYFTKYGDGGADLLPIGGLVKREVVALARDLKIEPDIADRPPSAGLWTGQTDEEEIGFRYAELERYLELGPQDVPPALAMRIERLIRSSEHKRLLPPIPDE